ncbi:Protein p49 OS=Streptomyces glaucescens OX=1907 GN=p49 PE=4 SV=1 [Streptomyces glaucescens]
MRRRSRDERAKTLFAGLVAHVMAPLSGVATGAIGLVFALAAHARGWPVARGGSQSISDALAAYLKDLWLLAPGLRGQAAGPPAARTGLRLRLRHGAGPIAGFGNYYEGYLATALVFFKVDYALDGRVPVDGEEARSAGTVQIGADSAEIGRCRGRVPQGRAPDSRS